MARVWTRAGGATTRPARTDPSRGVPSATITKSLDPESRWKATTIGNRGAGGQDHPAGGGDGSQPDLGGGLSWFFVWFSAEAQPARCAGRALRRNYAQESELGAGSGDPSIFRSNRACLDDKVRPAPDRRQANRPLDPEMAKSGRDGAGPVDRDRAGNSARFGDFADSCQSLPALRSRS